MTRTARTMSTAVLAMIAALVITVTSFVIAPSAAAYTFTGCRSSHIAGNYADYFRTGVGITTYYSDTINRARDEWNSENVPGSLSRVTSGGDMVIERRSFSRGWYALASWTCGSNDYFNGGSRAMALNSRTMDPLANWQDRFVIIHEFGALDGTGSRSRWVQCGRDET